MQTSFIFEDDNSKNDLIQIFNFENHNVEVIMVNGEPLFNARHVGACLDMTESTVWNYTSLMSVKQVVKLTNEKLVSSNLRLTDVRKLHNTGENFLTEKGVYKLILKSRKPSAEKFQDWVCDEVLPSIRKHGMYATPQTINEMLDNPDVLIQALQNLKAERLAKEEAIRTKALIGSRREATCMNVASQAVKKVNKIASKIGESVKTATTLKVLIKSKEVDSKEIAFCLVRTLQIRGKSFTSVWDKNFDLHLNKPLRDEALRLGLVLHKIDDGRSYKVITYPAILWKNIYNIDLSKVFALKEDIVNAF